MMARILIVEDEIDLRDVLADVLEWQGYEVDVASNGREALKKLADRSIDLLITDLMMPVMDGGELIERLRGERDTSSLPIIVTSAVRNPTEETFLRKPVEIDELVETVRRELARKRG